MNLTKDKLADLIKKYSITLINSDDVANALWFVRDLLYAEADATKEKEPYATRGIARLEDAAYEVFELINDVEELSEELLRD